MSGKFVIPPMPETSPDREAMVWELSDLHEDMARKDGEIENVDIPAARSYWRSLPMDQLQAELNDARAKTARKPGV